MENVSFFLMHTLIILNQYDGYERGKLTKTTCMSPMMKYILENQTWSEEKKEVNPVQ